MEKWRNLSIKNKFRGLIIFTILLTILNFVKDNFSEDRANANIMNIGVLEARRAEKDFLIRKKTEYIEKVKKNATLVIEIAEEDGGETGLDIASEMKIYLSNFENASDAEIELGLDEESGIRGAFRKAVHSLEEIVKSANMLQLEVDMLTIRRSEKDYIIRGSEKYVTKVKTASSKFIEETRTSKLSDEKKQSVISLINKYDKAFAEYVNIINKRKEYVKIYTDHAHAMAPLIEKYNHEKHLFVQIINVVFNIFIVLIVVAVYLFGKMLVSRLKRITDFAEKVEDGNLDDSLNGKTLDEIGILSRTFDKMVEKIATQIGYLDNLPTPITIMDSDFNVEYINKFGASLVGANQNKLDGIRCFDLYKTDHCNTEKCAVGQAMRNSSIVTEETTARPKGNEMEIMYTGAPIKDKAGKVIGALEYVADISEMKERENYLERSTETILGAMEKFSQGDLTAQVKAEKEGDDISKLFEGFNTSVGNIRNMIEQVKEAVEATASASTQISSSAEEMAAGAQEQSAQTSEVAAAMEEMSRTVVETAANATNSAEASKSASKKANEGSGKLNASKEGMQQIVEATDTVGANISSLASKTDQIGEIAQVIDDIADQTNLLALNAAIEAARAGEQGRGFAVVADEVRKLAERTTKATKEIAETIKAIQVEAKDANSSMEEAGVAVKSGMEMNEEVGVVLTDILERVDDVSQQINQVAAASEEQSATAEQVSSNIESINNVANESAAVVQQIASASEDLNRLTENLSELVQQFQLGNGGSSSNNNYLLGE